jgi:hypothetical protein
MSQHAVDANRGSGALARTAWVGWIYFAGAIMVLVGSFSAIEGLVALFNDEFYTVTTDGLLVFDLTGWGWVHLIIGALAVVVGVGLFTGAMWARVGGVVLAIVNSVAQLAFVSAYPWWSMVVIALNLVVIWAIIVHGDEAKTADE